MSPKVDDTRQRVRALISNAYYDARNARETMETAADNAVDSIISEFVVTDRKFMREALVDLADGVRR